MPGLPGRSLAGLRAGLRSGRLGVGELISTARHRIECWDAKEPLNAFLALADERLERQAREAARSLAKGAADTGALTGIPIAVKDNICTLDLPTTCGSRILEGYRSPYEATAVRRLRDAGALLLGKTNLDEFAMGSSTENSAFGPTRNPWDPDRVPGGSSGGSAAAVAAGIVVAALGSDTGGSIRQPASLCGVVGLRPTWGLVSRYGLTAFASSLDQIGTLGRTVRDAAELLGVIAGPDPRDATCADAPAPRFDDIWELEDSVARGIVVGLPQEYFPEHLDPAISSAVRAAVDRLAAAGAVVREVSLPHTEYAIPAYYLISAAEASSNLARYDGVRFGRRAPDAGGVEEVYRRSRGGGFGTEVKRRIMLGTYVLSAGYHRDFYERALGIRNRITADFDAVFADGVDVIITPTTPTVAFRLGAKVERPLQMYLSDVFTVPASLAGLPAISVPVGTSQGLPIGAQAIAPRFGEVEMVRAACALESTRGPDTICWPEPDRSR